MRAESSKDDAPKPEGGGGGTRKLLLFLLLQTTLLLLLAEGGARWLVPRPKQIFYDKAFPGNYEYRKPEHFARHRTRFWRLKSDAEKREAGDPLPDYHVNRHFLRGPDFEPQKRPGTYRIVCLGDSNTFGVGLRYERTFCHLLGAWLQHRGDLPAVEAINAGTPGYSSLQGVRLYEEEIAALAPDLLTLYFGWNDQLEAPIARDVEQHVPSPLVFSLQEFLGNSGLYTLLKTFVLRVRRGEAAADPLQERGRGKLGYRPRVLPEEFARNYERIVTEARKEGSAVVAIVPVTLPKESTLPLGAYIAALEDLAARIDLPLIDLPPLFEEVGKERLFQGHVEERGG
ncbi:MAG: SGNH/GDSL hydrolase family protein, partial [Deltaproteobacteria bacterium]